MTLRCPYCRGTFEMDAGVKCPHCDRFVNLPRHLRPNEKPLRVSRRERTSRYDEHRRQTLTPSIQLGRKPSTVIFSLAVLAVVGGLLLVRAAARFGKPTRRTPAIVAADAVDTLATAADIFARECGRLPSAQEGFIVLISNPGIEGWDGPYITLIKPDPWEQPYRYSVTNGIATIASCGPDRSAGTPDDITATTQFRAHAFRPQSQGM